MSTAMQTDLFGGGAVELPQPIPLAAGRFALADKVATAMSRAIDAAGAARPDLAARVTALTGKRLTLSVLNCMTAMSRPDHVPSLLQAMAFDAATGQWALLKFYAEAAGGRVIFGRDLVALERGRVVLAEEDLRERKAELKRVGRTVR